jgi:hypothetical protein
LKKRATEVNHDDMRTPEDTAPRALDIVTDTGPEPEAPHSIGSLLILLSVPCVLPAPGIGNVMGLALMGVALLIWRSGGAGVIGRPALARTVALDKTRAAQLLRWMGRLEQLSSRWCRPRLQPLTLLPARSWQAAAAAVLVAIPLGNVLPAASITLLGMALKHRDGLATLWSLALAVIALAYPFLLGLGAWQWVMNPLWQGLGWGA